MVDGILNKDTATIVTDESKVAADKVAADKVAADKLAADKVVADKVAADKVVADAAKEAADKKAAEDAAKLKDGKTDKGEGAPEKYTDFTLPDGVELDKAALETFLPLAKEFNLSQANAQRLIDLQTKMAVEANKAQQVAWDGIQTKWRDDTKADKEIGGSNLDANVVYAKTFLKTFGTPELMAALDATGVGNHPEFIRAFVRAGKAISEDKLHFGGGVGGAKTAAEILFPNQVKA